MSNRIEQQTHIDADPSVVFDALTSPDLLCQWLCHEAEVQPRIGGKYHMTWRGEDAGTKVTYDGDAEITSFEPGRRLTIRLAPADGPSPDSSIEFALEAKGGGTDLHFSQTGFDGDAERDPYQRGWQASLAVLRSLIEDQPGERLVPAFMHRDIPSPADDPAGITWDGEHLWVADAGRGRLYELEPRTGKALRWHNIDGELSGLTWDGEYLWQADREDRVLIKIDPRDGKVQRKLKVDQVQGELTGIAWDGQHIWVADHGDDEGRALRVNPRSGLIDHRVPVVPTVSGLAWDGTHLWAADYETRVANRLDPRAGAVEQRVALKGHPTGLCWDGERMWYADAEWKLLSRIVDAVPSN